MRERSKYGQLIGAVRRAVVFAPVMVLACAGGAAQERPIETFRFALAQGRLSEGPALVRVKRGARVELVWSAAESATIHLHGYDVTVEIAPRAAATMTIDARATGRFAISLHMKKGSGHAHRALAYLEVLPD